MSIWRWKTESPERSFPTKLRLSDPERVTLAEIGSVWEESCASAASD
jgi:hypothetical protein